MKNHIKKIVVIPDSFKGSLMSAEICTICEKKINDIIPGCEVIKIPVADGGEGTTDCFLQCLPCEKIYCEAHDPYGEPMDVYYARSGSMAFIELAMVAGLPLVEGRMYPCDTSTYGVGEMIAHAVRYGCKKIVLGIGGSCTNDGGCGLAAALGVRFLKKDGKGFVPTGGTLSEIAHIQREEALIRMNDVQIVTICDIDNPMFGSEGAACIFGPQKGADPEMVEVLDANLRYLSEKISNDLWINDSGLPGAGAAGAVGAGMAAFFGSKLQSGIQTVLDLVRFDEIIKDTDLIITGEGQIDSQSLRGKVVIGIAEKAKKQQVPVLALVGSVGDGAEAAYSMGVTSIISINRKAEDFSLSRYKSKENLAATVEAILRLVLRMF